MSKQEESVKDHKSEVADSTKPLEFDPRDDLKSARRPDQNFMLNKAMRDENLKLHDLIPRDATNVDIRVAARMEVYRRRASDFNGSHGEYIKKSVAGPEMDHTTNVGSRLNDGPDIIFMFTASRTADDVPDPDIRLPFRLFQHFSHTMHGKQNPRRIMTNKHNPVAVAMVRDWMLGKAITKNFSDSQGPRTIIQMYTFAKDFEIIKLQADLMAILRCQHVHVGYIPKVIMMELVWAETSEGDPIRILFLELFYMHRIDLVEFGTSIHADPEMNVAISSWFHDLHKMVRPKVVLEQMQEDLDKLAAKLTEEESSDPGRDLGMYISTARLQRKYPQSKFWETPEEREEMEIACRAAEEAAEDATGAAAETRQSASDTCVPGTRPVISTNNSHGQNTGANSSTTASQNRGNCGVKRSADDVVSKSSPDAVVKKHGKEYVESSWFGNEGKHVLAL
jgi:hypothetical protein